MAVIGNLKGPQGVPGNDGVPGTVWHHGTGAPSVQITTKLAELTAARTGDYYLDDATGDYYVKAQAAGVVWTD